MTEHGRARWKATRKGDAEASAMSGNTADCLAMFRPNGLASLRHLPRCPAWCIRWVCTHAGRLDDGARRCNHMPSDVPSTALNASPQGGSALFGLLCVPRHRPYLLIRASPRALIRPKMDAIKCNDMSETLHYSGGTVLDPSAIMYIPPLFGQQTRNNVRA
jgi:hypothetical protein